MTNNSVRKTVVEQELPDLAAVRAAGIELSLEHARAVLMLWSRVIAHGQGKARNTPYIAARVIRLAVSAQVPLPDGGVLEPLLLGGETVGVPDGKTALRRLGLDSSEITAVWHESAPFATSCLPLEWVLAFLPAGAWPLVAALIDCSPGELSPRIDEALRQHGRTTGPAPLRNDVTCLWQVMKILVALNRELQAENASRARGGRPLLELPESLAGWTALPERPSSARLAAIARGGRRRDVSAVPVDRIHGALVNTAKRAGWGKWRPSEWPPNRNWRALKEFAVLCLLVTACPRVDHLRLLDVDDFDPNHVFEDGTTAPGLRFRRAKMKGGGNSTDEYWKQLPADVADVLTAWIHCSGRQLGQPGEPLLISIATKDREPGQRYADGASLSRFVAGLKGKRRPIIPTIGNDWHGYASHRFRHTLNQVVERRYAAWKLEHPAHELASYDPRTFGELALDHTIKDLGYRDFRDRKSSRSAPPSAGRNAGAPACSHTASTQTQSPAPRKPPPSTKPNSPESHTNSQPSKHGRQKRSPAPAPHETAPPTSTSSSPQTRSRSRSNRSCASSSDSKTTSPQRSPTSSTHAQSKSPCPKT